MGVKFPKTKTTRHPAFLEFVRTLPCCICNGYGPTEAHHSGQDRGMGIKADDLTAIALCMGHHREYHNIGRLSFETKHQVSLWEIVAKTVIKYVKEREL